MATQSLEQLNTSVGIEAVANGTDLIELYYDRGWSDGLPVVPPTQEKLDAIVEVLGGDPQFVECKVAPRWGALTREVLAINMVMAGCRPEYAPIVRAAMLALTDRAFNLNGVQATTHVASPLIIVNGPLASKAGMNGGANAFGSGNRANATIGRAVRLIMLNVGGGWPPSARFALRSTLLATPLSGAIGGDGAFSTSFTPPTGVLPGDYLISANVGSLLAESQTCTLR